MTIEKEIIKIGYVPEHFSTPLYIAADNRYFTNQNVEVELVCCPGGTGEMTSKLKDGSINVAIALTEGLVAGLAKGQDWFKIVGTYVNSPLCWAISGGQSSRHTNLSTLRNTTVAVSRLGSGSHIMAFVVADQQGWLDPAAATEPFNRFESLQNFKAMRDAVNGEQADFFMWETFMTKPYHDSGELKRLGEITPPWPAFSIAARRDLIARKGEDLRRALAAVDQATALFVAERDGRSVDLVVERLGHDREDVRSWFKTVSYPAKSVGVSRAALEVTLETLRKAGVVEREVVVEELVDTSVARLDA